MENGKGGGSEKGGGNEEEVRLEVAMLPGREPRALHSSALSPTAFKFLPSVQEFTPTTSPVQHVRTGTHPPHENASLLFQPVFDALSRVLDEGTRLHDDENHSDR